MEVGAGQALIQVRDIFILEVVELTFGGLSFITKLLYGDDL